VPVFLGDADVPVSYEVQQDATNLVEELTRILRDAARGAGGMRPSRRAPAPGSPRL
jgi:hypothetical protein